MNHRKKLHITASLAAALTLLPAKEAHAGGAALLIAQATPMIGTMVTGACDSTGMIVNDMNLRMGETYIKMAMQEMAGEVMAGFTQNLAELKNRMNQELQSQALFYKRRLAAQAENNYLFETTGINALSHGCEARAQAQSNDTGTQTLGQWVAQAKTRIQSTLQPVQSPVETTVSRAAEPQSLWSGTAITSAQASSDSVSKSIGHLISPVPQPAPQNMPTTAQQVAQSNIPTQKLIVQMNEMKLGKALTADTLLKVSSLNRPTINDQAISQQWQDQQEPGTLPGTDASGKNISRMGLFEANDDLTYSSAQYHDASLSKGEAWQVKQTALSLAQEVAQRQQENDLLERALALQSTMLAQDLKPQEQQLEKDRSSALVGTMR